jgi:CubicO group peptidase (beta-lactamase class C family)
MYRVAPHVLVLAVSVLACGDGREQSGSAAYPAFGAPPGQGPGNTATDVSTPGSTAPGAPGSAASPAGNEGNPELPLGAVPPGGKASAPGQPAPIAPSSSPLPRSTPEAEGLSSAGVLALVEALDSGSMGEIHSLMLLRHGKVVAEGWWAPYAPEDIHVLYSVSKSFNATAVGLAVADGLLAVDDLLVPYFADLAPAVVDPELAAMQIRHLLTMSTGHTSDSIDAMRQRSDGQWMRSFLEGDVQQAPGSNFLYNSGAAYMLGALVQRVTGLTVEEYLKPRLFEPLGVTAELWGKSQEGVSLGDGGLSVRTEDLAKFGQLHLQGGVWNGEQVVPAEWVANATARQVSSGEGTGNWNHGYGYQFWQSRVGYRADGSLGQFSFVLPEQDIVLAITSGTNDTDGVMNAVWDNLLPAVLGDAQPENAAALGALGERLAALSLAAPDGAATSPLAAGVSGSRYVTAPNSQGISAVSLDFSGASPVLLIEDANGPHSITVGMGEWVRQRTGFKQRINELFDTPDQGLAARGAWSAEDTFVARLTFNETPYTATATFKFEGEQVRVNMGYNVRWGALAEAEVSGSR